MAHFPFQSVPTSHTPSCAHSSVPSTIPSVGSTDGTEHSSTSYRKAFSSTQSSFETNF